MKRLDILKKIESGELTFEEGKKLLAGEAIEKTPIEEKVKAKKKKETEEKPSNKGGDHLEVSLISSNIKLYSADLEEVVVEIYDVKGENLVDLPKSLEIKEKDGLITILERVESKMFGISWGTSREKVMVKVGIPEHMPFQEMKIKTVSGKMDLENIKASKLTLDTVSGKALGEKLILNEMVFKSVSGSGQLTNCQSKNVTYKTVSGNFLFTGRARHMKGSTVSGRATVKIQDLSLFNLHLSSVSGRIDSHGFAPVHSGYGSRSVKVDNRSEEKGLNLSSVSGSIEIDEI